MCTNHHLRSTTDLDFSAFCSALRQWLADSPLLDPPLAAAADLLDRRLAGWFECEIAHMAWNAEDMHAALGANVVLSLWNAARTGAFSLP
jgi:hypothetical protein